MMGEKQKTETVYCIKYALTQGIIRVSGSAIPGSDAFMRRDTGVPTSYLKKNEWARNGNEALELARDMRQRKIKSIEKQRDKLLQMGFELPDKPKHPAFNVKGTISGRVPCGGPNS